VDLPAQIETYVDKRVVANNRPRCRLLGADAHTEIGIKEIMASAAPAHGKRFFYCDGGDKALEANMIWPYLLRGDLLGLHDYSDDPAAIGPEVFPDDIKEIIMTGRRRGRADLAETRIFLTEKV
jgi:hypothetical protein